MVRVTAAATDVNIQALRERARESPALEKYAHAGRILSGRAALPREEAWKLLVQTLNDWIQWMDLPRLRAYGVQELDIPNIVTNCRGSSMKTNPVELTDAEIRAVLLQRL